MQVALSAHDEAQPRPLIRRLWRHLPVVEAPGLAHFMVGAMARCW